MKIFFVASCETCRKMHITDYVQDEIVCPVEGFDLKMILQGDELIHDECPFDDCPENGGTDHF